MEKGYYKTERVIIGYLEEDVEHKDNNGQIIYIEHKKTPQYEEKQVYVEYTEKQLLEIQIYELKQQLSKFKEDVEQVELFGMERADYEEKKKTCAELVLQLRALEKELSNLS